MKPNSKAKSTPPVFACLPRELLVNPPVGQLQSFDIATACGVLAHARSLIDEAAHEAALRAGANSIQAEKFLSNDFKSQWRRKNRAMAHGKKLSAPMRWHTYNQHFGLKPADSTPDAIKKAGRAGYRRAKEELRRQRVPNQTVILSRSAILRLAGLSSDGKNLAKVDASLKRLAANIKLPKFVFPALIVSQTENSSGDLVLKLSGSWFDPPFGKVPLPIPTRSSAAVALYLFLASIRTYASNKRGSTFQSLCVRLGIAITGAGSVARRSVNRALDVVNSHVQRRLPIRRLARHGIDIHTYKIRMADESGASIKLEIEKQVQPPKLDRVRKRVQPVRFGNTLRNALRYQELRERHLDGDWKASALLGLAPIEDE